MASKILILMVKLYCLIFRGVCIRAGKGWFLPERFLVVFAICLRPCAIYLRICTFVYVLDPRYLGIDMTPDQRMEVEEMMYSHPTFGRDSTAELQDAMVFEYTNFRIAALEMRRSGSRLFCSLIAKSISVLALVRIRNDIHRKLFTRGYGENP